MGEKMKTLREFTGEPGSGTTGNIRWEPQLEKKIVKYVESNSVLRDLCRIYPLTGSFVASIPKSFSTGRAVEVVEGTEIPSVRQVLGTVTVTVSENGTAFQFTDETKLLDWFGDYVERELEESAKRMLRKENFDILVTLEAGAKGTATGVGNNVATYEDLIDASTYMEQNYFIVPDTVFVNPKEYSDLVKDSRFVLYSGSNSTAPYRDGTLGGTVAGLNVVKLPEVSSKTMIVAAMKESPLWLVVFQEIIIEPFRIPDIRSTKVQLTAYVKPAVLNLEAIRKISITAK